MFKYLIFLILISCVPQGGNITIGPGSQGAIGGPGVPGPDIFTIAVVDHQLIINGKNFLGITHVTLKDPATGAAKPFAVKFAGLTKLISDSIDTMSVPLNKGLDLILSNAYGQTTYPVTFTLQPNAVAEGHIQDGAVTRLKLNKEPGDNPGDGDVLSWDSGSNQFVFAPYGGGGGGGGVQTITRGVGIANSGTTISVTGAISVDVDVKGHGTDTRIPHFNHQNKIVLDSTTSAAGQITGLNFKDGTSIFDIYNDGGFLDILNEGGTRIFSLDNLGDLKLKGSSVCTQATGCSGVGPGAGVTKVTAAPPLGFSGTTDVIINAGAVNTSNNLVQLDGTGGLPGIVFGPGKAQRHQTYLDNLGTLNPNDNYVIIGNGTSFEVQGGDTFLTSIGAQKADSDLSSISGLSPALGNIIVGASATWTTSTIPNCASGYVTLSNGTSFSCSNIGSPISAGTITTYNQVGLQIKPVAGTTGELHFIGTNLTNYVGLKAADATASDTIWTLPPTDGAAGSALITDGAGTLAWVNVGGGNDLQILEPSTDKAIVRFKGNSTKEVQNSAVFISDTNDISGVSNFTSAGTITNTGNIINSGNLSVDGSTLSVDSTTHRVGVGTSGVDITNLLTLPFATDGQGLEFNETTGANDYFIGRAATHGNSGLVIGKSSAKTVAGDYSFMAGNDGSTYINAASGKTIHFKNNNGTDRFSIDTTGAYIPSSLGLRFTDGLGGTITLTNPGTITTYVLRLPGALPLSSQALVSDPTGNLSWGLTGGDVAGPATSTLDNVVTFDGASGKLIKDSGIPSVNLVTNSSPFSAANRVVLAAGTTRAVTESPYKIPSTSCLPGEILKSNGTDFTCGSDLDTGNVVGSASSTMGNLPMFADGSGAKLADSGIPSADVPIMASGSGGQYRPILSADGAKGVYAAPYEFPNIKCPLGFILKADLSGNFICAGDDNFGDVTLPGSSTDKAIVRFLGNNPPNKQIQNSGVLISDANDISGAAKFTSTGDMAVGGNSFVVDTVNDRVGIGTATPTTSAILDLNSTNKGFLPPRMTTAQRDAIASPANGLLIFNSDTNIFNARVNNQWEVLTGDVYGPATSTDGHVTEFNGNSGNVIRDSGIKSLDLVTMTATATLGNILTSAGGKVAADSSVKISDVPTMSAAAASSNTVVLSGGADKTLKTTPYTIPTSACGPGQILKADVFGNFICGADSDTAPPVTSVFSRTGDVVAMPGDYFSDQISSTPTANISANNVKGALDEIYAEKLSLTGGTMTGTIFTNSPIVSTAQDAFELGPFGASPGNTGEIRFKELAGTNWVGFKAPDAIASNTIWTLPAADGVDGSILTTDGNKNLNWNSPSSLGIGDVVGPGSSASGTLASFDGITGKLIQDSGIPSDDVVTMATDASAANRILKSQGTNKIAIDSGVLIDNSNNLTGLGTLNTRTIANWVDGPANATDTNLASFDGTSGKLIKDSNLSTANIPTMASPAGVVDHVIVSGGADKSLKDSGILSTDLVIALTDFTTPNRVALGGPGRKLTETAYTIPATDGTATYVLKTNGAGVVSWAADLDSGGDVDGPATSTVGNVTVFNSVDGKVIADSGIKSIELVTMSAGAIPGNILKSTGGTGVVDSLVNIDNVPTMSAAAASSNTVVLSEGADKKLKTTPYTIPTTACALGELLIADASGNFRCGKDTGGVESFNGRTGAVVSIVGDYTASMIPITASVTFAATSTQGALEELDALKLALAGGTMSGRIDTTTQDAIRLGPSGPNTGEIQFKELNPGTNFVGFKAPDDLASDIIWTLPDTAGASGTFLTTDGFKNLNWNSPSSLGIGDVVGPGASVSGNLASFDGITGKLIQDSNIASDKVMTMTANATEADRILKSQGANKIAIESGIFIDSANNVSQMGTLNGRTIANWVDGPANATDTNLAAFDGPTGKLIKDSNLSTGNIPTMASPAGVVDRVIVSGGADKSLKDSGILYTDLITKSANFSGTNRVALSGGMDRTLTETSYTIPATDGTATYVLKTNGAGVVSWAEDLDSGGDVDGPATSTVGNVTVFNSVDGKVIADSGIKSIELVTMSAFATPGNILTSAGGTAAADSLVNILDVPTMFAPAASSNTVVLSEGADKKLKTTPYTIPTTACALGELLIADASGNFRCGKDTGGVESFNGRTGKVVSITGDYFSDQISSTPTTDISADNVKDALDEIYAEKLSLTGGDMTGPIRSTALPALQVGNIGVDTGEIRFMELFPGAEYVGFKAPDAIASNTIWTLPAADGVSGDILTTDGANVLSWNSPSELGIGDVVGPGTATDGNLASFDGSGKLIQDSNIASVNVVTMNSAALGANRILTSQGANKVAIDTGVLIDVANNVTGVLGFTSTGNMTVGGSAFFGDSIGDQVGIGTTTPDASAILDLTSTTKGLLLPRMTTGERDLIGADPTDGLLIYNITTKTFNGRIDNKWEAVTGDVYGPGSSTPGHVTMFGSADGKVIADSGIPSINLVTMTASATDGNILTAIGGKSAVDSTVNILDVPTMAAAAVSSNTLVLSEGADKKLKTTPYTFPSTLCSPDKILKTDASGNFGCVDDVSGVTSFNTRKGDVVPMAGDYFSDQISSTPTVDISANNVKGALDEIYAEKLSLTGGNMTGTIFTNSPIVSTAQDAFELGPFGASAGNTGEIRFTDLTGGKYVGFKAPDDITSSLIWTLPAAAGGTGTILTTNGNKELSWNSPSSLGIGDVVGPSPSTQDAIAKFSDTSGKKLSDSGILINVDNDLSGVVDFTSSGIMAVGTDALYVDSAGKKVGIGTEFPIQTLDVKGTVAISSSTYIGGPLGISGLTTFNAGGAFSTFPTGRGASGQFLKTNGGGVLDWADAGDVVGPASSASETLVAFDGISGKLIKDSGILYTNVVTMTLPGAGDYVLHSTAGLKTATESNILISDIPTMAAAAASSNTVVLSEGADKKLKTTTYTIPSDECAPGELLIADADGNFQCGEDTGGVVSFNGRTGIVTPTATDYTASMIANTASGTISATNAQDAINEINAEKLSLTGGDMTGAITTSSQESILVGPYGVGTGETGEIRFEDLAGDGLGYVGFKAPDVVTSTIIWTLPSVQGNTGDFLTNMGSNRLDWTKIAGGANGIGDVVGPSPSTLNAIAKYSDTSGKKLSDSNIIIGPGNDLSGVVGFTSSGDMRVATNTFFVDANANSVGIGNAAPIATLDVTGTAAISGNTTINGTLGIAGQTTFNVGTPTSSTFPIDRGALGQFLSTDGNGTLSWADGNQGDVVGPALSSSGTLASFFGTDGKTIQDSGIIAANVPTMTAAATGTYQPIVSAGSDKTVMSLGYSIPSTPCLDGQILKSDSSGNLVCADDVSGVTSFNTRKGDVVSMSGDYTAAQVNSTPTGFVAATTVQAAIAELESEKLALAGGTMTGELITTTQNAIRLNPSGGNAGEVHFVESAGGVTDYVGFRAPATLAGNIIWTLPAADGLNGNILTTDGNQILSWNSPASLGIGDVVGLSSSTDGHLASYDGNSGKVIEDSGIIAADVVTNPSTATDTSIPRFSGPSGKIIQGSSVLISATNDVSGIVNFTSTGNMTVGGTDFFVDPILDQVGIGTAAPDISAILDLNSSTKGLLLPRMATAQRDAITSADGFLVYNSTTNTFDGRMNGVWKSFAGDVAGPATSTDNALARFDGTTGKLIQDSVLVLSDSGVATLNAAVPELILSSTNTTQAASNRITFKKADDGRGGGFFWRNETDTSTNIYAGEIYNAGSDVVRWGISKDPNPATNQPWFDITYTTGAIRFNNAYTFPTTGGSAGQVLTSDGVGALSWATNAGGDVTGPAGSASGTLASFDGTTGKLIKDSGIVAANVVQGPGTATATSIALFNGATGKLIQSSGVLINATNDVAGVGAFTSTGNMTVDNNTFFVNATGDEVGIGTQSPYRKLDVVGDIVTSVHGGATEHDPLELIGVRRIGHTSGQTLAFAGMWITVKNVESDGTTASANNSHLSFYTWGQGISGPREVVRITERGRLGIGTPNPTELLDVRGNARLGSATSVGNLKFFDTNNSNFVALQSPANVSSDTTWTLPAADGASGTMLATNGSGVLSWNAITGGTGGIGNVVGPASAVSGTLASFDGITGKLIKDSGIVAANVVTHPSTATDTAVPRFSGPGGKIIQGSNVRIDATNNVTGVGALTATGNLTVGGTDFFVDTVQDQVGIGTGSPTLSAILDLNSSTKGLLLPRMATAQRDAITSANGFIVYNSTTNSLDARVNGAWQSVSNNVSNATPTTDNAIARFDGGTGKIIQGSSVLISDTNDISGVQNFTAKGTNSNTGLASNSAINLMIGRTNAGALSSPNQTSADIAFEYGGGGGGFKHFITTTHNGAAGSNQNSFRFYLNNGVTAAASSAPGTNNILGLAITPVGVGILTSTPTEALEVGGNIRIGGASSVGKVMLNDLDNTNYVTIQAPSVVTANPIWTLPAADGASGTMLATNGSGGLSWAAITGGTGGIGNVVGPGSSTDNAIARFDLGTGKLIQNSGVIIDDSDNVTGIQNLTVTGTNSNTPSAPTAALNLMIGRNTGMGLSSGQTSADIALEFGGTFGYKHYISSTHTGTANNTGNSINFYINNGVQAGSTAPGIGNVLALGITPIGVGVLNTTPTEALDVRGNIKATGQAYSTVYPNGASLSFNFNNGNVQYSTLPCGASTLSNMVDGGSYQVAIQGATSGTCTFTHAGLTFRYAPANGVTTANSHSVYSMTRIGSFVYVSWITGFIP